MFVVPRVPPTDFVLKPDSTGKGLIATWKAPDPTKVNGRVSFYKIIFRKVGSKVENTTEDIPVRMHTSIQWLHEDVDNYMVDSMANLLSMELFTTTMDCHLKSTVIDV